MLSYKRFFFETYKRLNKGYRGLFGQGGFEEQTSDEGEIESDSETFEKRWGWVYNAELIAKFERVALNEVWKLNIIQALNSLAYLKDKNANERRQLEKLRK